MRVLQQLSLILLLASNYAIADPRATGTSGLGRMRGVQTFKVIASSVYDPEAGKVLVSAMQSPEDTWREVEEGGVTLLSYTSVSLFLRALAAGIFVGFGGILTTSVGFDMGAPAWSKGQGVARMLSGLVGFPLSIMLVSITGNGAWTGDALLVSIAYLKRRIKLKQVVRFLVTTYLGCFAGTFMMAMLATVAALPCVEPCIALTQHKLDLTLLQTFARGIGGGGLICLAIFMSKCSRMMTGKVVSILFPISAYVISDFEHVLASMFFMSTSLLNQDKGGLKSVTTFLRFLVPSTLGNLVGGALLVGAGLSSIPKKLRVKKA